MPALAFDTHAYVKKLRDAGVPEPQAEIQVEAIAAIIEARMATKQDLELQKLEVRRDIKELDVNLEREIAEVKREIRELDVKLERELAEVKREIKELDVKLERELAEVKRDIKELDVKLERELAGIRRDIKELDVKLETRLKELEMRLLIRLGGLLAVSVGAIATLIKLL